MTDIKKLMEEFETAEAKANVLDDLWGENPEDEKLEEEWMAAYKEEHRTCKALIDGIREATKWEIDERAARAMIYGKRATLKALFAMI